MEKLKNPKWLALFTLLIFLGFGIFHIGKFTTADEHYWFYERVPQYWKAVSEGKWKKTKINDKPGITVALVSGVGLLLEREPENHFKEKDRLDIFNSERSEEFYFHFRFPILLFNFFLGCYIFWILGRIFSDRYLALWGGILAFLSPIIVGMSQIVNPDALIWSVSLAAALSFVAFLKTEEKKMIIFSGFFTGLALLSKYTANILFVFYLLLILVDFFVSFKARFKENIPSIGKYFRKNFLALGIVFVLACACFGFFMPAAIRNPKHLYLGTLGFDSMKIILPYFLGIVFLILLDGFFWKSRVLGKIGDFFERWKKYILGIVFLFLVISFVFVIVNRIGGFNWLDTESVPIDAKTADIFSNDSSLPKQLALEFYPLIFSLTPLVLFSLLFLWVRRIWNNKERQNDFLVISLSLFLLMFSLGAIFSDLLLTTRYWVIMYPFLGVLAGIGILEFWKECMKEKISKFWLSLGIILISSLSLVLAAPFYYNYTSSLLPKKYIVSDLWGFGGYEAAAYLNSLPNAKNLTIWSDYYGVCDFFVGKCSTDYKFDKPIDYFVITRRGEIRFFSEYAYYKAKGQPVIEATKYYTEDISPEWQLMIGGRKNNFVKMIKAIQ